MVETWLLLALGAMLLAGINPLNHRIVMKSSDWLCYGFFINFFAGIFFLVVSFSTFSLPQNLDAYLLAALSVVFVTFSTIAALKSAGMVEASDRITLKRLDIVFVLMLSYIILFEAITYNKVFGAALIFIGTLTIGYKKGHKLARFREPGTQLTVLSALMGSITLIIDKLALRHWAVTDYSVIVFLVPGLILGALMFLTSRQKNFRPMLDRVFIFVAFATVIDIAFFYLRLVTLTLAEASAVFLILRLSTLVTVVLGIALLHERDRMHQKIISALIMIAGGTLVSL